MLKLLDVERSGKREKWDVAVKERLLNALSNLADYVGRFANFVCYYYYYYYYMKMVWNGEILMMMMMMMMMMMNKHYANYNMI